MPSVDLGFKHRFISGTDASRAAAAAAARHRRQRGRPHAAGRGAPSRCRSAESAGSGAGERRPAILPAARGGRVRSGRSQDPHPSARRFRRGGGRRPISSRVRRSRSASPMAPTSPPRCSCCGPGSSGERCCSGRWCRWSPSRFPRLPAFPWEYIAGRADPIVRPEQSEELAALLRKSGAQVEMNWIVGGHGLTREDLELGRQWLSRQ